MGEFFHVMQMVIDPYTLLMSFVGVIIGMIVGAMPGLGPVQAMALLLPFTFKMPPLPSLAMLAAIYVAAHCGDCIPAILIGVPGTAAAAADLMDGYPLAQQGRATEALNISIFGSFVGGMFSVIVLLLFAGPLVAVAVNFGPPEYFWLACWGLSVIAVLSEGSMVKGLIAGALGVCISTVGMDLTYGHLRFTFDNPNLIEGIPLLPPLLGFFAFTRILDMIQEGTHYIKFPKKIRFFDLQLPSMASLLALKTTFLRSSIIGTFIGILPGAGGNIASWIAYGEEKRASKNPEKFGKGAIEGLAAPETANNAVTGGAMLPLLTLGIPGSPSTAVMYAGITMQGLAPGLELFTRYRDLVYALIIGLFLANIMTLASGVVLRAMISRLLSITPYYVLTVSITTAAIIGAYCINNNMFHVYMMLGFGVIGFFLTKFHFPLAPIILGIILGPMLEMGLRQSLALYPKNFWMIFLGNQGISALLVVLLILTYVGPMLWRTIKIRISQPKKNA